MSVAFAIRSVWSFDICSPQSFFIMLVNCLRLVKQSFFIILVTLLNFTLGVTTSYLYVLGVPFCNRFTYWTNRMSLLWGTIGSVWTTVRFLERHFLCSPWRINTTELDHRPSWQFLQSLNFALDYVNAIVGASLMEMRFWAWYNLK